MAFLDMTDVIIDPDLASVFTVIRRTETVDNHGRPIIDSIRYEGQVGVITHASPGDLRRSQDADSMMRKISVVTPFALQGPAPGFKPDQIEECDGVIYTVTEVLPYRRFGAGFTEALAQSMNAIDAAAT